jgi:nucleotide-binding universal stress UspA family protein
MTTLTQPLVREPALHPPTARAPIIVATDGTAQSNGALAMARLLATQFGTTCQAVAAQPSATTVAPGIRVQLEPEIALRLEADLTRRVREQCARIAATPGTTLEPELVHGEPSRVISRVATERRARLIVMGIGRHAVTDRVFGSETALKVARVSRVPVLAVPEGQSTPLKRAVVGVDFSEPCVRAAQAALSLLAEGGVLQLVHVVPRERLLLDAWVSADEYAKFVRHSFNRLLARLEVPPGVQVQDFTLSGDAGRALLSYTERMEADLIAAGSHGHGFVSRLVIGSVTAKLLRGAGCAVLVTPPDVFRDAAASDADARVTLHADQTRWAEVLDAFTRTNAGRRTRLEVDDPELGAQAQEQDYPLRGVTFDRSDQRVEIMLGELGAGAPHLSRGIGDVDALDVLTDKDGNDVALRLRHGGGQTILTLLP